MPGKEGLAQEPAGTGPSYFTSKEPISSLIHLASLRGGKVFADGETETHSHRASHYQSQDEDSGGPGTHSWAQPAWPPATDLGSFSKGSGFQKDHPTSFGALTRPPALHPRRYDNMQCKPLQPWTVSAKRWQVMG